MKDKYAVRKSYSYTMSIGANPNDIFPLLCPKREYEWIPDWKCKILFSLSGQAELGCVFITDQDETYGTETWTVSTFVPNTRIAFVRTGEHRSTRYVISLSEKCGGTSVTWFQEITGITSHGMKMLEDFNEQDYNMTMRSLQTLMEKHLAIEDCR